MPCTVIKRKGQQFVCFYATFTCDCASNHVTESKNIVNTMAKKERKKRMYYYASTNVHLTVLLISAAPISKDNVLYSKFKAYC